MLELDSLPWEFYFCILSKKRMGHFWGADPPVTRSVLISEHLSEMLYTEWCLIKSPQNVLHLWGWWGAPMTLNPSPAWSPIPPPSYQAQVVFLNPDGCPKQVWYWSWGEANQESGWINTSSYFFLKKPREEEWIQSWVGSLFLVHQLHAHL